METNFAARVWDGTNINRLKIHFCEGGVAICNTSLKQLFSEATVYEVTCNACKRKVVA